MLSLFLTYALSAAERLKKGEETRHILLSFKINAAPKVMLPEKKKKKWNKSTILIH